MSASLSRGTGRQYRPPPETSIEPDEEWIKATRARIELELRPDLEQAEKVRNEKLSAEGLDEAARDKIEQDYEDLKATYITIASVTFKERVDAERMRRRGLQHEEADSVIEGQKSILEAAKRSIRSRTGDDAHDDISASPQNEVGIDQPAAFDEELSILQPPSRDTAYRPSHGTRYGTSRYSGDSTASQASFPITSAPTRIPPTHNDTIDGFVDGPLEEGEPQSYGSHTRVGRKQSSGSMSSARSKQFWRHEGSPKDTAAPTRVYEPATSPSTIPPRRDSSSNGRSGIATAFAQSPPPPAVPMTSPARRDSNASIASSKSGGVGSLPRTSTVPRRDSDSRNFAPRTPLSPYAPAAGPVYTPPFQSPYASSPVKKESSASDFHSAISLSAPRSRSPLPPIVQATNVLDKSRTIDVVDEESLQDTRASKERAYGTMSRAYREEPYKAPSIRTQSSLSDLNGRRPDSRPVSSASRPSPIVASVSPNGSEPYRPPPSSYSSAVLRRYDDDRTTGIPIPSPSERALNAPQASPEWPKNMSYGSHRHVGRKTSFNGDGRARHPSISPESVRVPYGGYGRRNSVSSYHSGRSGRSHNSYQDPYGRVVNDEWSPLPANEEHSHDESDSDDDYGGDDMEYYSEELRAREEELMKKEEEIRQKEEESKRKEAEAQRKEAEAKRKEEEAKRKEEEVKLKEAEAQRKELEVKRKEEAAKRKEEDARRKQDEARRKEDEARAREEEARAREEDARRKEDELRKKEEETERKEEEMRILEEVARHRELELERKEEEARQLENDVRRKELEAERKEAMARLREEALSLKEEEFERMKMEIRRLALELNAKEQDAIRKEEEAKHMEDEARRREEDARRREEDARRKEEDARKKEEDARRREEYAKQRMEDAKQRAEEARQRADDARQRADEARIKENMLRKREEEFKLREEDLRKREQDLERREADIKRLDAEKRETESLADFARGERRHLEELIAEQQRIHDELSTQRELRAQAEALAERLQTEERQRALAFAEQEEMRRAEVLAREEERRKADELAEDRRRAEAAAAEERRRIAQEERRRHEAVAMQEDLRRQQETARKQQEELRIQEEARRRAEERKRQESFLHEAARSGTPMSSASQAANMHSSSSASRHNSAGSNASTASNSSWGTNASWASWASAGSTTSAASSSSTYANAKNNTTPRRTTSTSSYTPSEPSTRRAMNDPDMAKWQERQEEQARKQAEAFRKEQEKIEKVRQAKAGQMLSREAVLQIFDDHERRWSRIAAMDTLGWNDFAWPMLRQPSDPEEMTTTSIAGYVLNPYAPGDKSEKDRIKEHIRRWHPDRFETKLLPKVRSEEQEKVKDGAGQVVRSLNELLTRSS